MAHRSKAPRKRRRSLTGGWARLPIEGKRYLEICPKERRSSESWAFDWIAFYVDDFKEYPSGRALRKATGWRAPKAAAFLERHRARFLAVYGIAGAPKSVPETVPETVPENSLDNQGISPKSVPPTVPDTVPPQAPEGPRARTLSVAPDLPDLSDPFKEEEEASATVDGPPAPSPSSSLADDLLKVAEEKHKAAGITPTPAQRKAALSALSGALGRHGEAMTREALDALPVRPWRWFVSNLAERLLPKAPQRKEAEALAHASTGRGKVEAWEPTKTRTRLDPAEECREAARWFEGLGTTEEERMKAARSHLAGQFRRAGCEPSRIVPEVEGALQRKLGLVDRARQAAPG
jgi:hypothetical protein